jgi:hypothetical protein
MARSLMIARQARVSVAAMRRWESHDPGRSCRLHVITHYVTNQPNSQNDGALPDRDARRQGRNQASEDQAGLRLVRGPRGTSGQPNVKVPRRGWLTPRVPMMLDVRFSALLVAGSCPAARSRADTRGVDRGKALSRAAGRERVLETRHGHVIAATILRVMGPRGPAALYPHRACWREPPLRRRAPACCPSRCGTRHLA